MFSKADADARPTWTLSLNIQWSPLFASELIHINSLFQRVKALQPIIRVHHLPLYGGCCLLTSLSFSIKPTSLGLSGISVTILISAFILTCISTVTSNTRINLSCKIDFLTATYPHYPFGLTILTLKLKSSWLSIMDGLVLRSLSWRAIGRSYKGYFCRAVENESLGITVALGTVG